MADGVLKVPVVQALPIFGSLHYGYFPVFMEVGKAFGFLTRNGC